jgi:hypothetical protein
MDDDSGPDITPECFESGSLSILKTSVLHIHITGSLAMAIDILSTASSRVRRVTLDFSYSTVVGASGCAQLYSTLAGLSLDSSLTVELDIKNRDGFYATLFPRLGSRNMVRRCVSPPILDP